MVYGSSPAEPILEPDLPIIDPHHHLWFLTPSVLRAIEESRTIAATAYPPASSGPSRFLFDELMADLATGHNVRATVFIDAHAMYRADGPESMKSLGEVEFVNGIAAMGASGVFGDVKVCAGIVGNVDLRLGDAAGEVLQAHVQAGGGRYRGVRCSGVMAYSEDRSILGSSGVPHLLLDAGFRGGFKWLGRLGLSFDAFVLEPQLPDLIDLAQAFPDTLIVINHLGTPLGVGRYAGQRAARFPLWRERMQALAACSNVSVKLGGIGLPFAGFDSFGATPPASSKQLAAEWKPYVHTCIELFGVDRCMFESNFPVDARTCSYPVLWNVFKRLVSGASPGEKTALFNGTARRFYRLDV